MFVHIWCEAAVQGETRTSALETISSPRLCAYQAPHYFKGLAKGSYRHRFGLCYLLPCFGLLCLFCSGLVFLLENCVSFRMAGIKHPTQTTERRQGSFWRGVQKVWPMAAHPHASQQ